jgi:DNA (cytosine-5)-methyltransferase 1
VWRVRVPSTLDESARIAADRRAISLSQFIRQSVECQLTVDDPANVPSVAPHESTPGRNLKTVSLFTGAGGLDVGLDATGRFDLLAAVELQPSFCKSLSRNRDKGLFGSPSTKVIQADLSTYTPAELMAELGIEPGDIDVLVGGPPCQSFSTAGRRAGVKDPRGQLIWNYLDFVRELRPKVFLMENVRGLLSAALQHRPIAERPAKGGPALKREELPGSVFDLWLSDALDIGDEYRVDTFEVNAVNYGAPQLRERVLVFGNRLGRLTPVLEPTHSQDDDDLPSFTTLREALDGLDEDSPTLLDFSPRKKNYLDMVPMGGNWRSLPDEVAQESMGRAYFAKGGRSGWWRRLSWDLPSPTITTMPNHSSTSMCHPEQTRVLSVAECARVQEFPDGWEFLGTVSEQMKQVGNAVPARLGTVAGETVARIIDDASLDCADAPRATQTYLNSHVRTRRWWKDGQAVVQA